ncbi:MAG: catechol 1,2-dioxygenase [Actinobacteria bacterium]|jgi:3,4-dihydroxyphenylacetate 2,3-dioxygenase|nr:catechol 1,2-dioxygenase [Actinomycetota bacterium]MBT3746885.1 catechol 1,2-dioxygenase [Actinomycetota bacterium]MBT3970218.1 catechol 1,2-dioxygenase [Actinomycetota bacterium]MBT4010141.1 catechol 1,2-dioxygenase [Actinomycetota bacterium]MBT4303088.1 catechol 1,2-dioxygenase [Actinomycetota bacterium]
MGEIVGAAIISHVPPIVMPEADRRALNDGKEISLVPGLRRLREEKVNPLAPDTIVVLDTHWFTLVEMVVTAHDRRIGHYTSDELPRGMVAMPYDIPGDPQLAHTLEALATDRDDTWITANDDPHLPIHYATVNLLPFLQGNERWMTASICGTASSEDFLLFGQLLGQAIRQLDRRVLLIGSGGLSHRFWPLQEFRQHESSDPINVITPEARAADQKILASWEAGDHRSVIDNMKDFRQHAPEGMFGHYLMMAGALGGRNWTATGELFSDYEAAAGTGQAHVWFDQPANG